MAATVIIIVAVLLAIHLLGGAHSHVKHRRAGLNPRLSYTFGYGWYGSLRLPGGFRLGHHI
jgi:hypothetical protein